ncbi:ATP-binding cassette domain-containing protein [Leptolyngbya sp. NK1-12]|uniref:ATP-binding cassette domain-containing protein n=1 Tax=Leptolyngbya sp. NK1-12 TaxID=2547451 RepID=A0AA96WQL9_9CYAN|nr:ATP-binding cassette domain-containing protein [Elainella sp. C42_A2020_010]RNJ65727.1 MAG: ATP-binding cassette domain-containing protein [Leptolyngbya sp. IPPAS B-1204]WNZ27221.1 ATP-binding cassette domain-containing protein [Leptolyngbya sp. NK1-12]
MLIADQVCFRYSPRHPWVLHQVNLEVAPAEVVGLQGPSGFGKTTLGKLLAGYLTPTQGCITLAGKPLPPQGYCPVQMVFQSPESAINPRWRIAKVLQEGQFPSLDLQARLGIHSGWLDRFPHELSGGELQRIAVARVLNPQTRYLIADEMTAMLDANTQALIWQAVLAHAAQHRLGILVISHEAALLRRICHRVVDLSDANTIRAQASASERA